MKNRTEYKASAGLLGPAVAVDPFGHLDTALELGTMAAQLGLTVDDLQKMVKSYLILQQFEYAADVPQILEILKRAVKAAHGDG